MTVREASGPVTHPDLLWGWVRVDAADHPDVTTLYDGAPALGWEADSRLCLYKSDYDQAVILVRLEHDGEYRTVLRRELTADERLMGGPANGQLLGPEAINRLIQRLIDHDNRRGFDPIAATIGVNEAMEAARDKEHTEWIHEEISPKVVWALQHSFLPGFDVAPRLR